MDWRGSDMSNETFDPVVIEVVVADPDQVLLADLDREVSDPELTVGPVREVSSSSDLFFDLGQVISTLYSVTMVITGIGGAAKTIDWVLAKLRNEGKNTIRIHVGSDSIIIRRGDDPQQTRKLLQAAMKML
jgi:hypothetical protein